MIACLNILSFGTVNCAEITLGLAAYLQELIDHSRVCEAEG
jgi:hypothetical protein